MLVWEAVCIRSSSFTFPSFVFSLSGYAGMRVLKCVADLVQAAHSCVTLQDTVLAEGQITAFTTLILLSIVWYRLYLVTQQKKPASSHIIVTLLTVIVLSDLFLLSGNLSYDSNKGQNSSLGLKDIYP